VERGFDGPIRAPEAWFAIVHQVVPGLLINVILRLPSSIKADEPVITIVSDARGIGVTDATCEGKSFGSIHPNRGPSR
jgi:hypothetical protein